MKNITKVLAIALLAVTPPALTYAHGVEDHSKKTRPVTKEQKEW